MDNSFFAYRDKTSVHSDSDTEIIDNSLVEESFTFTKTPAKKNQSVFVPESEGSSTDDESAHKDAEKKVIKKVPTRSSISKQHLILSSDDDESPEEDSENEVVKTVPRRSSVRHPHVISSSDDDIRHRGSIRTQIEDSTSKNVASSSEDEGQVSPEMLPKRRPLVRPTPRSSDSFIGRKNKKRMFCLDSDTDNSIVIEHEKHKKLTCIKDTPLKPGFEHKHIDDIKNMSIQSNDSKPGVENDGSDDNDEESNLKLNVLDSKGHSKTYSVSKNEAGSDNATDDSQSDNDKQVNTETDEDDNDDDHLVMSRATRMSIMGIMPKDNESDDSDYIHSDDSNRVSQGNSVSSLPEIAGLGSSVNKTPEKVTECDGDTSRLTCSPFTSPSSDVADEINKSVITKKVTSDNIHDLTHDTDEYINTYKETSDNIHDLTHEINNSINTHKESRSVYDLTNIKDTSRNKGSSGKKFSSDDICDLTLDTYDLKKKVLNRLNNDSKSSYETVIDEDITIIDSKPEIIALSSDDEDEPKDEKKSPNIKKSPKPKDENKSPNTKKSPKPKAESAPLKTIDNTIKQYLIPPSYPNQVVYVKKHVRENELSKLNGMREDIQNIRYLLENMDVNTLPDGGVKLIERMTALEAEVRQQGDKVANMVVEPDDPTPDVIANDGFDKENQGLSWDDIQKASNAVQPRMFGKQAMATHMAERNLILERLRDLHEALGSRPADTVHAPAPRALRTELMPHQRHALAWLRWRETQRPRGGLLADDMGLGKTITMISLVACDKEDGLGEDDDDDDEYTERGNSKLARGGTLVVCPASLVQQWAGEVTKHCAPHSLSVCMHHGANRATQPHRLAASDIVITTYNILQRESEKAGALSRVVWRRAIVDEAHAVRNHKSATSAAVAGLRARRRWALTGTPLHNRDLDLFALLKFLKCTPFDDLIMWKKWIDNKSLGGQERLNTIMRCIMLRRTKQQLQEQGELACLPTRTAHTRDVTLRPDEMNVYQKVLVFSKTLFAQFLHQRAEKQADAMGYAPPQKDSAYRQMHKKMIALQGAKPVKSHEILVLLLRLRQVCCHCGLIAAMLDEDSADAVEDEGSKDLLAELNKLTLEDSKAKRKSGQKEEEEEEEEEQESTSAAEAIRSVLSPNNPAFDLTRRSSKIDAVMACLEENVFPNKGEKAVVVSQWTSVLRLVEQELKRARVRSVTLNGSVPVAARAALVDAVNDPNSDVKVMLLSLMAGGVGLNLCGASHLLLLDPHWNPQLEQQAQDRVYRVGQLRPVHVYSFMCVDTVEQSIRQLQRAKLELAASVLTGARPNTASKLTIEDLRVLFNMGPAGS